MPLAELAGGFFMENKKGTELYFAERKLSVKILTTKEEGGDLMEDLAHRAYLLLKAGLPTRNAEEELIEFGASPEEAARTIAAANKIILQEVGDRNRWEDEGGPPGNDSSGG